VAEEQLVVALSRVQNLRHRPGVRLVHALQPSPSPSSPPRRPTCSRHARSGVWGEPGNGRVGTSTDWKVGTLGATSECCNLHELQPQSNVQWQHQFAAATQAGCSTSSRKPILVSKQRLRHSERCLRQKSHVRTCCTKAALKTLWNTMQDICCISSFDHCIPAMPKTC
jgi:hypothetical protein